MTNRVPCFCGLCVPVWALDSSVVPEPEFEPDETLNRDRRRFTETAKGDGEGRSTDGDRFRQLDTVAA